MIKNCYKKFDFLMCVCFYADSNLILPMNNSLPNEHELELTRSNLRKMLNSSTKFLDIEVMKFAANIDSMTRILQHLTSANDIDLLLDVMNIIHKSKFKNIVEVCWQSIIMERVFSADKFVSYLYDTESRTNSVDKMYKLIKTFSFLRPTHGERKHLYCSLSLIIEGVLSRSTLLGFEIPEDAKTLFEEFRKWENDLIKFSLSSKTTEIEEGEIMDESIFRCHSSAAEINDMYSTIAKKSILPSTKELFAENCPIIIEANKTKGPYENEPHYFAVQYNLLREDFLRPLREGVNSIKKLAEASKSKIQYKEVDVKVYNDVHIVAKNGSRTEGVMYKLQFSVQRKVQWKTSKRLKYGSLLCLFKWGNYDCSTEVIFAVVANRQINDLEAGYVEVTIEHGDQHRLDLEGENFVMVESEAFYLPYKHVLEGLKDLYFSCAHNNSTQCNTDSEINTKLPFVNNIIFADSNVRQIKALKDTPAMLYNFRSLFTDECEPKIMPHDDCTYRLSHCSAWPSPSQLGLDNSQSKALHLALTREISLIQGPPGTGKTFVGLKIVQMLLNNIMCWNGLNESGGQILVVCYTNHALDQFLEGILKLIQTGKASNCCKYPIVRLGSRCKSDRLTPHIINNLRKTTKRNTVSRNIMDECDVLEAKLKCICEKILLSDCELISGDELVTEEILSEKIFSDLKSKYQNETMTLVDWLFQRRSISECIERLSKSDLQNEKNYIFSDDEDEYEYERRLDEVENRFHIANTNGRKLLEFNRSNLIKSLKTKSIDSDDEKLLTSVLKTIFNEKQQPSSKLLQRAYNDIWSIKNMDERSTLYSYWQHQYRCRLKKRQKKLEATYDSQTKLLRQCRLSQDKAIMKQASIIGMTTTAAAGHREVLNSIGPKIVIVEEAAEIFEAHIVTSLSPKCQQLILIGDHKQLRPKPNVYELECNYNLGISLFERLLNNGLPCVCLKQQHRMPPCVSRLLVPHIYPMLKNHKSVLLKNPLKGLRHCLYFVKHETYESNEDDSHSHKNDFEADFLTSLAIYLIKVGYKPSQITLLTFYTSQVHLLRQMMSQKASEWKIDNIMEQQSSQYCTSTPFWTQQPGHHKQRRMTTGNVCKSQSFGVVIKAVDDYQGEENDIILLSTVRSNKECRIGFLASEHRICVALSRCRLGLIAIGNFTQLAQKCKLWREITNHLCRSQLLGDALELLCPNSHPQPQITRVITANDLKGPAVDGGCSLTCDVTMSCGHTCKRKCHSDDPTHDVANCKEPCLKILCSQNHPCPKQCGDQCAKFCKKFVKKIIPRCGHERDMYCYENPNDHNCKERCNKLLLCGHKCRQYCYEECDANECKELVKAVLQCGHEMQAPCPDHRANRVVCKVDCGAMLLCEHKCVGTCSQCRQGRLHAACKKKCERILICGDQCKEWCTSTCPPCKENCKWRCLHGASCRKKCGELCVSCKEPCRWKCKHLKCKRFCFELCDRLPCNEPCKKVLKCSHPCIGLCGEKCPKLCRVCEPDKVKEIFFGTEEEENARFIQLTDCGHIFEVTGLDKWMDIETNESNEMENRSNSEIALKCCPKCKKPIMTMYRYGNQIRTQLITIDKIKSQITSSYKNVAKENANIFKTYLNKIEKQNRTNINISVKDKEIASREAKWLNERLDKCLKANIMSPQEAIELEREVKRFNLFVNFQELRGKFSQDATPLNEAIDRLNRLDSLFNTYSSLSDQKLEEIKEELSKLMKFLGLGKFGISEDERIMIVKAIGFTPGHWFKCPSGKV